MSISFFSSFKVPPQFQLTMAYFNWSAWIQAYKHTRRYRKKNMSHHGFEPTASSFTGGDLVVVEYFLRQRPYAWSLRRSCKWACVLSSLRVHFERLYGQRTELDEEGSSWNSLKWPVQAWVIYFEWTFLIRDASQPAIKTRHAEWHPASGIKCSYSTRPHKSVVVCMMMAETSDRRRFSLK